MKVPSQPETNIGMIGHVDHGKTMLTKALTGEQTDRHSEEVKRGISIRLGYADVAFYKCKKCPEPECYSINPTCKACGGPCELLRSVSFVDAPGHETLMATMLSGAAIMNGALLLVAANETCPQPQTREHLMALSIIGVDKIIVVQNKIDLVSVDEARKNYQEIREFVSGTIAENAPIVPLSAMHDVNIDMLIKTIEETIPTPKWERSKPPRMHVARSFDINVPGTKLDTLKGGVLGGPGGLIAIGTGLDPAFTKSDSLVGRLVGKPGTLPDVKTAFTMRTELMNRVVGVASELAVESLKTNEPLMLSVGTATTVGVVTSGRADSADIGLKIPVCVEAGQRVAISRRIAGKWRLIGHGIVQ
ncbi:MAG: translation initiation factor IF-2 subunit gamma [Thermoplasmata archaeon]|nr:translation initiation factor IF-2 subunit gamma [Thermoplasmata archaeon]